jgi:Xaa-Pro aminopeptidase
VTFEACDEAMDYFRAIKSPDELERLRSGAVATDRAIAFAYEHAQLGYDERQLETLMRTAMFDNAADEVIFLCLGAGPHSIEPHHHPCSYKLKRGDIIRVDIGGAFSGYFSDLARTAVVGKPTPEQAAKYRIVWDVMEEIIAAIKPGEQAKVLYGIYKKKFEKLGLPTFAPHVGHSLGIKVHERPMLMPFEEKILEPNMVLEIEVAHLDRDAMYHNEDQVVVTRTGHEVVSRTRDWSQLVQIE